MEFLDIFSNKKSLHKTLLPKITIDHREKNSLVASELSSLGHEIEFKQLPVADYISNNVAIERKTISDFKSSIINKRLPQQLLELKQYPSYFLILEGNLENNDSTTIHENAFRGFLLTTILEFKVPVIFSINEKDTAKYISVLAKKQKPSEQPIRASKILLNDKEQLQFILEGFPQIGPIAAKKLLKRFHTLKSLSNASLKELQKIIGKKSELLHKLLNKKY